MRTLGVYVRYTHKYTHAYTVYLYLCLCTLYLTGKELCAQSACSVRYTGYMMYGVSDREARGVPCKLRHVNARCSLREWCLDPHRPCL